jgi:hypothetical protein
MPGKCLNRSLDLVPIAHTHTHFSCPDEIPIASVPHLYIITRSRLGLEIKSSIIPCYTAVRFTVFS